MSRLKYDGIYCLVGSILSYLGCFLVYILYSIIREVFQKQIRIETENYSAIFSFFLTIMILIAILFIVNRYLPKLDEKDRKIIKRGFSGSFILFALAGFLLPFGVNAFFMGGVFLYISESFGVPHDRIRELLFSFGFIFIIYWWFMILVYPSLVIRQIENQGM